MNSPQQTDKNRRNVRHRRTKGDSPCWTDKRAAGVREGRTSNGEYKMPNAGKRHYKRTLTDEGEREVLHDIRRGEFAAVLALTEAIRVVYPELAKELLCNIVAAQSYETIERRQGYVPLNRADFYGCRRKVLSVYATMRGVGEQNGVNSKCDSSTDYGSV